MSLAAQQPLIPTPIRPEGAAIGLVEIPLADLLRAEAEPVRFILKPWLPRRHVTLFGGHGGIGKSSIALAIAAHVACGHPFAGMPVEQSAALFVSLEDEPAIVRQRLRQIIAAYALPADRVLASLRLLDGTQGMACLMTEADGSPGAPILTAAYHELAAKVADAGLIVIDNASDAFDANENSRRAVRAFMRALVDMARRHDAAVMLLAHIDKAAAKGHAQGNNYSGSTAWHNSARSRLALTEDDGRIRLTHEKANLSSRAEPVTFSFCDGIAQPQTSTRPDGMSADDFDRAQILRAMHAASEAGIIVPANCMPGAHSAMKALEPLAEYRASFEGSQGRKRAAAAVTSLLRSGHLIESQYTTSQRKIRKQLEVAIRMDTSPLDTSPTEAARRPCPRPT